VIRFRGHEAAAHWAGMINPGLLIDSTIGWLFGVTPDRGPVGVPSTLGGFVFLAEIVLIVLGTFALLVRRYRKI
jgi:ABC-2 type transport system permease protein